VGRLHRLTNHAHQITPQGTEVSCLTGENASRVAVKRT
jgi:hypothetical protein